MDERRSRIVIAATITTVLLVIGVAGFQLWSARKPGPAAPARAAPVATATITRTNLATTLSVGGQLGYGSEHPVKAGAAGQVTWLPKFGSTITRDEQLFRVDDQPVVLFYGRTPLFRRLATTGLVGHDVRVVADNLRALGYTIGDQPPVGSMSGQTAVRPGDSVLTASLRAAIKRWQHDVGATPTGVLELGSIVVQPQPIRVSSLTGQLGDPADSPSISVTGTSKVVITSITADEMESVRAAKKVTITLPSGDRVKGRIKSIARVVAVPDGSDTPAATATITVDRASTIRNLDSAPVQVEFTAQARNRVLAVPVGALLALSEGGYAVQVRNGALLPVTVGLFAKGMVEIKGHGVSEGMTVVTAS